jgi:hypothetical protein
MDLAERARTGEYVGSISDALARIERLPYVALASGLTALGGSVAVLGAGRVVAAHLGDGKLAGKLGVVALLVGAGGTGALVGQLWIGTGDHMRPEMLLTIGAVACCVAVGLFVAYVSVLGELLRVLRARVVNSAGDAGRSAW